MSGVRVQNIDPQCPEKLVWQYFTDLCGVATIKDVYYPLLNNNAIVIFQDPSAMTKMLTSRHEKWVVLPLPNQVFSKHRVWLDGELTTLLQSQEQYQEVLRNNAQVDISMDKGTRQITLTGQSYQIEWAWRYLSNLQDQQQHSSGFFRSVAMGSASLPPQPNGAVLPNGDLSPRSLHANAPPGHRPPHHPTVHNGSLAPVSEVTSSDAVSSARHRPSPGLGPASPRGQDRGQGGRRTEPPPPPSDITSLAIEGLWDEPQTSPSTTGAAARLTPQERPLPQPAVNGAVPKSRVSPDDDPGALMAAGGSEPRVPVKNLTSQAGRHASAEDNTISAYVSLPAAARVSREQARSPAGRHSQGFKHSGLDNAEVIYRAPSYHQSVNCPPPQDDDYDDDREPQSLTLWGQGQGGDPNYEDVGFNGASGGPRAFSSLPYNNSSSSLRLPANSKLALLNRSVVELSRKHFDIGHRLKLKIYMDDITRTRTDAVVNAANWELKNIGGVAGALAKAAGPEMEAACRRIYENNGALRTAQVVKTKAYGRLSHLKYVFHTVGPIYRKEDPDKCVFELAQTFLNCLLMADKLNLQSLTFPFISAGIFGMPIEMCVMSLFTALLKYNYERHSNLSTLEEVHFINNDMDIVCNAVLSAEAAAKRESMDSSVKRMVDGEKLYGRSVYPFCDQSAPAPRKKDTSNARYASWDSSADQGASATGQDSRGRQPSRQRTDHSQSAAVDPQPTTPPPAATGKTSSGARARSRSSDHRSKTATADSSDAQTSSTASGRDPSPMPRPRSRSNSFSGAHKGSSSSSRQDGGGSGTSSSSSRQGGGGATSTGAVAPRSQPQIKQSIVPTAAKKRSVGLAKSVSRGRTSDQSSNDTDQSSAAASETEDADRTCPICLDDMKQPKTLPCGHKFCAGCADKALAVSPRCPKCQRMFGIATGTQPRSGTMSHTIDYLRDLPGYQGHGMITITYDFPSGRQEPCHPNPGQIYASTHRVAYLPNSPEGRDVLKMLQKAFDHRLVFTIGDSVTTGAKGVITWNDIHHKTSTYGGPSQFGYPDPDYLFRVKEELAAKGITHP